MNPELIRVAIVLCKRANCTGEESLKVASAIHALETMLKEATTMTQTEVPDGNDPHAD